MKKREKVFPSRVYLIFLCLFGLLPTLLFTLFAWVNGGLNTGINWLKWSLDLSISVAYTVIIGFSVTMLVEWLRVNLPWKEGVFRRLVVEVFSTSLLAAGVMILLSYFVHKVLPMWDLPIYLQNGSMRLTIINDVFVALMMNTLLTVIFEGMIFFKDLQESERRAAQLEKERLQGQLEILKHQLKPHFLFNSLNVLSSLIHRDLEQSEEFIAEFSRIYRYVLETHQQSLVPLDKELEFVHSYLFLQKIRFGEALKVEVKREDVREERLQFLPPLSLQLVLENAIKHNLSSLEQPLEILVEVLPDEIRVRNGYLPRVNGAASTGMGQDNLRQRYRLLEAPEPTFFQQEQSYWAILPLVDPSHESIDR